MARATPSRSQLAQGLATGIKEASRQPYIILFIDELHTVVGTGSAEGASILPACSNRIGSQLQAKSGFCSDYRDSRDVTRNTTRWFWGSIAA